MSFKDVMKDTIKTGGFLGIVMVSSGFLTLAAYRLGYIDACKEREPREKQAVL